MFIKITMRAVPRHFAGRRRRPGNVAQLPAELPAQGSVVDFPSDFFPVVTDADGLASDKLEIIRQQVQYHLDHEEQKQLNPARERSCGSGSKANWWENAVIVAHYYTAPAFRRWRRTGGCVSDSLEMARFGHDHPARTWLWRG